MRIIAALRADLEYSDIGTHSRLSDELGGAPILRQTIERVARVQGTAATFVLCPAGQRDRCERICEGTGAIVREFNPAQGSWKRLGQVARKWSLDGWRGGIGGSTYFDEFVDVPLLHGLLQQEPADVLFAIPAAVPVFSVELAGLMIAHFQKHSEDVRLVFTQAVPGLAGLLLHASLIGELLEKNVPVGTLFSYKPDAPRKDLVFQTCCLDLPAPLRFGAGRLVADTDRSILRLRDLLREGPEPSLDAIGSWLVDRDAAYVEPFPREVELELTTDDPYPDSILRPRGTVVGRRGPISLEIVERVAAELSHRDDSLLVLGGFGDPLRHPQFREVLQRLRPSGQAGVFGVAIRTTAADVDEPVMHALVEHRVDILNVLIDAWTPQTYGRLQSPTDPSRVDLGRIMDRLAGLAEMRRSALAVAPLVVPEFCKVKDNAGELDDFHDGWIRRAGAVSIVGYSHHRGRRPDRGLMDMRPPVRGPCRRIRARCSVLADGTVTGCDEDFTREWVVGRVGEQSLAEIWQSTKFSQLREAHRMGKWSEMPLCSECCEWHRP